MNEFRSLPRCKICGRDSEVPNYQGIYFRADKFLHQLKRPNSKGLERWPMSLGSFHSLLLHENVVSAFRANDIQGANFHQIAGIQGRILDTLPPPPKYYKIEPLINTNFFPSLEEFDLTECQCGIIPKQRVFGEYKAPFEIDESLILGKDIFSLLPGGFWICVSKKVIDLLVKNQWTEEFEIGGRALPGIRVREFGLNWYEITLKHLRSSFPNSRIVG
jgi:hypothetical protein